MSPAPAISTKSRSRTSGAKAPGNSRAFLTSTGSMRPRARTARASDLPSAPAIVKSAAAVKGADKLLHMYVDIGEPEPRSIVAGIAKAYKPETLVGRKVVIVANLQPRKLRGLDSQGMIVAASLEGGLPVLAGFLEDVPVGARLK